MQANVMTQLAATDTQFLYITFVSDKISLLDQMILSMPHISVVQQWYTQAASRLYSVLLRCRQLRKWVKTWPDELHMYTLYTSTCLHMWSQDCHAQRCKDCSRWDQPSVQINTKQVTNTTGQWFLLVTAR